MLELYATIENPLVGVLARWSTSASPSTSPSCDALNDRLTGEVAAARPASSYDVVGRAVQPQLADPAARDPVRPSAAWRPQKKTKTGFSTDAATLEKLRDQWPEFIDPLLQYREVEKLRGTYGEGLLAEVAADGRIHATFNQTVARTGRLSLATSRTCTTSRCAREEGRQFRKAFVAAPGQRAARRRLQPDRAALHRPPRRGPGPDRGVHERPGHPQRHGVAGVRRRARRRSRSTSGRRRRWCRTGWPTAWRPTASGSG